MVVGVLGGGCLVLVGLVLLLEDGILPPAHHFYDYATEQNWDRKNHKNDALDGQRAMSMWKSSKQDFSYKFHNRTCSPRSFDRKSKHNNMFSVNAVLTQIQFCQIWSQILEEDKYFWPQHRYFLLRGEKTTQKIFACFFRGVGRVVGMDWMGGGRGRGVGGRIGFGKLSFVTWLQQMLQQQGKLSFKSMMSQLGSNVIRAGNVWTCVAMSDNVWHCLEMSRKKTKS